MNTYRLWKCDNGTFDIVDEDDCVVAYNVTGEQLASAYMAGNNIAYVPGVRVVSRMTGRTGTVCEPFGTWNGPVVHVQWDDGDKHIALPHLIAPLATPAFAADVSHHIA